ncbi:MAG: N-acetylglucosamine-6-phosphate deacetylase [Paenibacillus sp.]|nr:N-acetylglucosamine-6-phosphate deacetylase [Paenibacillus sp.]
MTVYVANGRIALMETAETDSNETAGLWFAPGLIDVQLNGFGGYDLNGKDLTVQTVQEIVKLLHQGGVTRFCPSIVTGTREGILKCVRTIADACEQDPQIKRAVIGIHVEGPYISADDGPRGAHHQAYVRDPDWIEFMEWYDASQGMIRKVTLAPEKPGALDFIRRLSEMGIVASIGHCNATDEDVRNAVEAGATMSTHLGNGAHPYMKRHPNYIWAQLAEDKLWAGLIADGHHLPVSTLKVMIRTKGSKAILTSDAVHLAGLSPGRYDTHINGEVVLEANGRLSLARSPELLAGAASPLYKGLEHVVRSGICTMAEAIKMATLHPAQLFGLESEGIGQIHQGSPADYILYRCAETGTMEIVQTVAGGEIVYQA